MGADKFDAVDTPSSKIIAGLQEALAHAKGSENSVRETVAVAVKADDGKLRWDLPPPDAMDELVNVYTIGAVKYADRNWENGMDWGRVFAAMMRHAWAWWRGETYDPKDGQHHLGSVAWCALTLIAYEKRKVGTDTRTILTEKKDV